MENGWVEWEKKRVPTTLILSYVTYLEIVYYFGNLESLKVNKKFLTCLFKLTDRLI